MKKTVMILLSSFVSLICMAQNIDIDETDLVGSWGLQSATGEFPKMNKRHQNISMLRPDYIEFYPEYRESTYSDDSTGMVRYLDSHHEVLEYNPETGEDIPTGTYDEYWYFHGIRDAMITNTNKLHIFLDGNRYVIRFKIVSFSDDIMELETLDGRGHLVYKKGVEPTAQKSSKVGDLNNDGKTDAADVVKLVNMIMKK